MSYQRKTDKNQSQKGLIFYFLHNFLIACILENLVK